MVASALWGCFDPNLADVDCRRCSNNECLGDFECRNGYCVKPGSTEDCSAQGGMSGTAGGSGASAGAGNASGTAGAATSAGSTGVGGTEMNTGGNASAGGSTHTGGAGGTTHAGGTGGGAHVGGSSGLQGQTGGTQSSGGEGGSGCGITTEVPLACSGQPISVELGAPCGTAPFHWHVTKGVTGLELHANRDTATLGGVIPDAGDYAVSVSVTDGANVTEEADLVLHVQDTPVVTTTSLPDVCDSELYAAPLVAEGGDGQHYDWSWSTAPSGSDLVIADTTLGGKFAPTGSSTNDVTLVVESDGCQSAPVTVSLDQAAPADCPIIEAVTGSGDLPNPCRGNDYGADLTALGPNGSYVWQQVTAPPGLTFDANTQHVSGTLSAPGALTVDVTGAGHEVERTFELTPRDTCFLAYVAPVNGVLRLGLFDPVTKRNRTLPSDPDADPVTDFKFSPDGRFLVYRTGVAPTSGALTLVEMPNPVEHALSFAQVSHYAWSDDSSTLAVGFTNTNGPALGGVDVAHPALGVGGTTYPELTPLAASVDSELVWYAGTHVAFLSARTQPLWPIRAATHEGSGFGELVFSDSDFASSSELRSGASGVYVVPSDSDFITFYGLEFFGDPNRISTPGGDEFQGIPHADFEIAGTGDYVAGEVNQELEVFTAGNPSTPDQYPIPDVPGPDVTPTECDAVLAWAPGADRLACAQLAASDPASPAHILFVDVSTDTSGVTTAASTLLHGVADFPDLFPSGRQRLFSRDGSRFAFTTADRLSVAKIVTGAASVVMQHDFSPDPGADDAVVAFAPAGSTLLEHRGGDLSLFDVNDASGSETVLDRNLPLSQACQDSPRAAAGAFCGSQRSLASFAWSPDATMVAHAIGSGGLSVVDLSRLASGLIDRTVVTDDCGDCLSGRSFEFQP